MDDRADVRKSIRALLSARIDFSVCGEAEDGIEAVERAKSLRPDVVVDGCLHAADGWSAGKQNNTS